jgi:hypothetical protein
MLLSIIYITIVTLILVAVAIFQRLKLATWAIIAGYLILVIFLFRENFNSNISDRIDTQSTRQTDEISSKDDSVPVQIDQNISSELITENEKSLAVSIATLKINSISMTRDILERTPGESKVQFDQSVGTIHCFTSVFNLDDSTTITHIWEYKGQLISEIEIPIGVSVRWRCWSQQSINPQWIGEWEVTVLNEEGQMLDNVKFQIVRENSSEI